MRTQTGLVRTLALLSTAALAPACGPEAVHHDGSAVEVSPGRAPRVAADQPAPSPREPVEPAAAPAAEPEPAAEPATEPAIEPAAEPEPEPELDDRQLALANVGRAAFDALQAGEFDDFMKLTPASAGPLREACPSMPLANRRELEARFNHCHQTISWPTVAEAQVFAGKPTGAPAGGCKAGIEDYGHLQLFLHMSDATIWRVDFLGAVGQDGNAIGVNGQVVCRTVDEAPKLGR